MELAEIFNETYWTILGRLFMNLAAVVVLGRFIYYPKRGRSREYLLTFIATSLIIFIVCIMLSQVKVEMGIALGLFAVFSVIRFRTTLATPRELSFLFVSLGLALLNALVPLSNPMIRLVITNLIVLAIIYVADYFLIQDRGVTKMITYDRLDLLEDTKRGELENDLKVRFGIKQITKLQVGDIDTIKGRAKIKVWMQDKDQQHLVE